MILAPTSTACLHDARQLSGSSLPGRTSTLLRRLWPCTDRCWIEKTQTLSSTFMQQHACTTWGCMTKQRQQQNRCPSVMPSATPYPWALLHGSVWGQHAICCMLCIYYVQAAPAEMHVTVQGPQCPLQNRILFHCAHKTSQEEKLMECHTQLSDSLEDQLSLASIHYLRGHYQVLDVTSL